MSWTLRVLDTANLFFLVSKLPAKKRICIIIFQISSFNGQKHRSAIATLKNRVAHSIQIYANIPEALFLSSKSGVFNPMSFMDSVRICDGFESGLKARFQKPAHDTSTLA
jgi:hypothetical protein